ncbi:MAG: assimilatory nitrate reductase catalytic subunit [Gammaproteobacteria bacterium]|jgi:assimilatory nitrate reductase catalytic subunit
MAIEISSSGKSIQTTCPYCGVGCGIDVDASSFSLVGSVAHPANFGRLCVKGTHLLETISPEGRLLEPAINGQTASWDEATSLVALKLHQTIARYGPDSVAFYVSGQLLTEDYYVANKLMKGFLGSANIDTNSRLCMSSAVAGYKRAFGADSVPCSYEDLEKTELLVLIGSNAAWTHPVLFQRMEQAKKCNPAMKVVVIDPRQTASTAQSDLNLHIKSGTDTILFNGLLNYLRQNEAVDECFILKNTDFADAAFDAAKSYSPEKVSAMCDIEYEKVICFFELFARSASAISFYSMGINQSISGVDNANAIINCHLATGKIGKLGSGPFSITGQPNAMGGREVGGLANMLAAHMDIENKQHNALVERFWLAENMVKTNGLKAVDMFEKLHKGDIKFIWIMATNPVVSMPNRQKIEEALLACDTVVVSDTVSQNDTLKFANIVLPATGWSEKDGTVTNSERRISRQRAIFAPTGQARHDWQIICDVAAKMGYQKSFEYSNVSDIFAEHAQLTAFENNGERDLDLSGLANLSKRQYEELQPIQWPVNKANPNGTARMFTDNKFFTDNRKAKFIPIIPQPVEQIACKEFPLVLNTGRVRDHWHTMTRTGNVARLHQHTGQAELSIHPTDADILCLNDGDLVSLRAQHSQLPVILPITILKTQRKGELFAPIHWSKTWSSHVNITSLFTDANDEISGQPELKHAAVKIIKTAVKAQGSLFVRDPLPELLLNEICDYWVKIKLENGYQYHIALLHPCETLGVRKASAQITLDDWYTQITTHFMQGSEVQTLASDVQLISVTINQDALATLFNIYINNENTDNDDPRVVMDANWINMLLGKDLICVSDIRDLLRNQPDEEFTKGKLICSCFGVREKTINGMISQGYNTVENLGKQLNCGTNCGSCKSELSTLISQHNEIDQSDTWAHTAHNSSNNSESNREVTTGYRQDKAVLNAKQKSSIDIQPKSTAELIKVTQIEMPK